MEISDYLHEYENVKKKNISVTYSLVPFKIEKLGNKNELNWDEVKDIILLKMIKIQIKTDRTLIPTL